MSEHRKLLPDKVMPEGRLMRGVSEGYFLHDGMGGEFDTMPVQRISFDRGGGSNNQQELGKIRSENHR